MLYYADLNIFRMKAYLAGRALSFLMYRFREEFLTRYLMDRLQQKSTFSVVIELNNEQ